MYLFPNDFYTSLNSEELALIKEFENTDNFGKDNLNALYQEVKEFEIQNPTLFRSSCDDLFTHKVSTAAVPFKKSISELTDEECFVYLIKPLLDKYPYEFLFSPFFILNNIEGVNWFVYDIFTNSFLSTDIVTKEIKSVPLQNFSYLAQITGEAYSHSQYRYVDNRLEFNSDLDETGKSVPSKFLLVVDSSKPYWNLYQKLFSTKVRINYTHFVDNDGRFTRRDWTSDSSFKGFEKASFELESLLNYYNCYKSELSEDGCKALREDIRKSAHILYTVASHLSPQLIGNSAPLFGLEVLNYTSSLFDNNF